MAWVGTAMYAAFAIGAPAGTALYADYGFAAIALATTLIPLVSLLLVAPRRTVAPLPHTRPKFNRVIDYDFYCSALCPTWMGPSLASLYAC